MKKKFKVAIVVDNPLRDLDSSVLVAEYLSDHCDVYLVSMGQARAEIFLIHPDLVLLNYLRVTNADFVKRLIASKISFSVLDTEGGVFMKLPGGESSFTKVIVRDENVRKHLNHYYCWGKEVEQILLNGKFYTSNQIKTLGTPRMDFYSSVFKSFYGSEQSLREKLVNGFKGKVVMIATSFPTVNPKFSTKEQEKEDLVLKYGWDRDFTEKYFLQMSMVMDEYLALAENLAKSNPEILFVVRPHPFENIKIYEKRFGSGSNILVSNDGNVAPWLVLSEILIHYECSTALEMGLLGKRSYSLEEFRDFRPIEYVQRETIYLKDINEFNKVLNEVKNKPQRSDGSTGEQKSIISSKTEEAIYWKVDGGAGKRVAQEILSSLELNHNVGKRRIKRSLLFDCFFGITRSILKVLKNRYLVPPEKKFSVKDVEIIERNLLSITGKKIKIKKSTLWSYLVIQQKG